MQSTVGIHIQPYGIHTTFVQNTKSPSVVESHTYPLSLDDNEEQRKIKIDEHFKEILKKYPPKNHHFSFIIPHKQISAHNLQFPFRERFKIQKALPFKIEDLIPFSMEEMVYSYKISGYIGKQSHVLSFIASQSEIAKLIHQLQSLGFQSYTLTPEVSALCNIFENWKEAPPEIQSLSNPKQIKLYLSYHQSIALVFHQDRLISTYNLNWGFRSCVQDIADKYRRDSDQALDYFFENATLTHEDMSDAVPISKIIRTSFKDLAQQLQLLLIYLKGQHFNEVEEIVLLGPGSNIQNLSYHLYEHVKIPIHKTEKYKDVLTPAYLPAFGATLESFKRSKNPAVNFSQSLLSTDQEKQTHQKKIEIFKRVSLIALCFFAYIEIRNWQASNINDETNGIFSHYSRSIAGLKTRNISIEKVEDFLNQEKSNQNQSHLLKDLAQMPSAIDQLKKLSFSFNQLELWQMTVSQMSIEGDRISIQGVILKPYISRLKNHLKTQAQNNTFKEKKPDPTIVTQSMAEEDSFEEESQWESFNFAFTMKKQV